MSIAYLNSKVLLTKHLRQNQQITIIKKYQEKYYLGHFCQWAALNTGTMTIICMMAVYLNLSMPSPLCLWLCLATIHIMGLY